MVGRSHRCMLVDAASRLSKEHASPPAIRQCFNSIPLLTQWRQFDAQFFHISHTPYTAVIFSSSHNYTSIHSVMHILRRFAKSTIILQQRAILRRQEEQARFALLEWQEVDRRQLEQLTAEQKNREEAIAFEQTTKSWCSTFNVAGERFFNQQCLICSLPNGAGLCVVSKEICCEGRKWQDMDISEFYCDCDRGGCEAGIDVNPGEKVYPSRDVIDWMYQWEVVYNSRAPFGLSHHHCTTLHHTTEIEMKRLLRKKRFCFSSLSAARSSFATKRHS